MKRLINYLIGLNVLVLGITLNTRSLLGVSAFTTLPYALKEMTPISFGVANIMLYMVLAVAQLLIERKLKMDILLEVPFSFIMGYILDLYQIISNHYNKAYSLCKNCFDITMIVSTIILCLVTRSPFYGIGVGTIFSALCVGRIIKWFEIKQFSLIRS